MDKKSNDDNNVAREQTRCFVCDAAVLGRFYTLATCRTQNSRTRVIEKLGELVGEGYMVVISEDDVICRSCGILVNTLDRLEVEMRKAQDHILHFLEQKYSLRDGELRGGGDKPKPCQPPQITRSGMKEISACCTNSPSKNASDPDDKRIPKSHSWLQCDMCKYTTHFNSFMVHHLRDHIKNKAISCDNCGHVLIQQTKKHNCDETVNDLGNKENKTDNSDIVTKKDAMATTFSEQTPLVLLPIAQTMPPPLTGLSNWDHLYVSNTLPMSDSTSSQESIQVLQQSIDMADNHGSRKRKRLDSNPAQETITRNKDAGRKHMLTMKEDGTLEVVEIPWNETEASDINSTIAFE